MPALWQYALALTVLFAGTLCPRAARAYTIQSTITTGCHELVTSEAYQNVRAALPQTAISLPARGDDDALMHDLTFAIPNLPREIGSVTLLLGVRDNDVKWVGPNDLEHLSPVASDPKLQQEHCLRAPDQDEPNGSRDAVEACRTYIREQWLAALDGLDARGVPDGQKREKLSVDLSIRSTTDVLVPTFFLHAGRGLHALEDSFTHTFRDPAHPGKIRVVLNYVEFSENRLNEAVDGPPHSGEMDRCDDPDELRTERHRLAVEAGTHALTAMLDPKLNRAAKERALDKVLDDYVSYDTTARCSQDNGWCNAPERGYGTSTLGCSTGGGTAAGGKVALLAVLLLGAWLGRRRLGRAVAPSAALLGLLCLTRLAHAAGPEPVNGPNNSDSSVTRAPIEPADPPGAWFGRVALGASYDHAAFSGGAGLRYQLAQKWMLGFDAEWNPYYAITPARLRAGSANAYFSLIRRAQLVRASVNIRSTLSLGGSMLLFDLVGASKYSVGPFFGVSFLGVEWKVARGVIFTVDPIYIALPVPSLTGIPFMYKQYRFLLGLELGG